MKSRVPGEHRGVRPAMCARATFGYAVVGSLRVVVLAFALFVVACSDSPITPDPIPPPPPPPPPVNSAPTIESITVQGSRRNQPPHFADVAESIDVSAVVRDSETSVEQLQYNWVATIGSVAGTGARVTWQAPPDAATPALVTLTLEVVERYGATFEHRVTRTADVALHNSTKEVGDMARQFLLDFSDTNIKDATYIMRNFGNEARCPQPREVSIEFEEVTRHYTNFRMIEHRIGAALVSVNFGGACPFRGKLGDACAVVPVYWHSFNVPENRADKVEGNDIIAASYARNERRWWLCASDFDGRSLLRNGASFYIR